MPRFLAKRIVEAAKEYRVSAKSLIGLVRTTVLPVPGIDVGDWARATRQAKAATVGLAPRGGSLAEPIEVPRVGRQRQRRRRR